MKNIIKSSSLVLEQKTKSILKVFPTVSTSRLSLVFAFDL